MSEQLKRILVGAGRLFDFSGSYSNEALMRLRARRVQISRRSTTDALRDDWEMIGHDMRTAMDKATHVTNGQS